MKELLKNRTPTHTVTAVKAETKQHAFENTFKSLSIKEIQEV